MLFDILLSLVFLGSLVSLWLIIGGKITELLAVPENTISAHLEEDSSQIRFFLLGFKSFFREYRYNIYMLRFAAKVLIKIRFAIIKLDNFTSYLLKRIKIKLGVNNGVNYGNRNDAGSTNNGQTRVINDVYWDTLKSDKNYGNGDNNGASA